MEVNTTLAPSHRGLDHHLQKDQSILINNPKMIIDIRHSRETTIQKCHRVHLVNNRGAPHRDKTHRDSLSSSTTRDNIRDKCICKISLPPKILKEDCKRNNSKPTNLMYKHLCINNWLISQHSFSMALPKKVYLSLYLPTTRIISTLHLSTIHHSRVLSRKDLLSKCPHKCCLSKVYLMDSISKDHHLFNNHNRTSSIPQASILLEGSTHGLNILNQQVVLDHFLQALLPLEMDLDLIPMVPALSMDLEELVLLPHIHL